MHPGLLVLGGFLLGTVGVKAVKSRPAHKAAVRATVCGLQAKDYVSYVIDTTKAECDDIMAEAKFVKDAEEAERDADVVVIEETVAVEEEPVKATKTTKTSSRKSSSKK